MSKVRSGFGVLMFSAALAASSAAFAGFQTGQQVVIMDANQFANGDLGYVHNTPDSVQWIGCYSYSNVGVCYAVNSAGLSRSCVTSDVNMVATIRSLNGDSYLYFGWNANGQCTFVEVENDSTTAPKR